MYCSVLLLFGQKLLKTKCIDIIINIKHYVWCKVSGHGHITLLYTLNVVKETQTKIQHEKESKKKRKKVSLVCSEFVKYWDYRLLPQLMWNNIKLHKKCCILNNKQHYLLPPLSH
jgi:hypothetical protein